MNMFKDSSGNKTWFKDFGYAMLKGFHLVFTHWSSFKMPGMKEILM